MASDFPPINRTEAQIVGRVFEDEVRDLIDIWNTTEQRLIELGRDPIFFASLGSGASGAAAAQQRATELIREVRSALQSMTSATITWSDALFVQAGAAATFTVESAATQGLTAGALGAPNADSIRLILEDLLTDTEFAESSALRTMRRFYRNTQQTVLPEGVINANLAISEARMENVSQRSRRLANEFDKVVGQGKFVLVNGQRFQLTTYADLVGRTRLVEANTVGSLRTNVAMGNDLVRVSDHGKTDPNCDRFAGKVFSISGQSRRFPRLREVPPFHPRCKHILLPFVTEFKSPRELEFAEARSRDRVEAGVSIEEFFSVRGAS